MSKTTPRQHIDQRMLRNGLILHARTKGFWGWAIRKCTGAWGNHDALLWHKAGAWWVMDAEPPVAKLTPFDTWEARRMAGKAELRFYFPLGAMSMDGRVACKWWLQHVRNSPYDYNAFPRLLLKAMFGDWWRKPAGKEWKFFCTESVRDAWKFGGFDPWQKNSPTPRTTEKRAEAGLLDDYTNVLLRGEEG